MMTSQTVLALYPFHGTLEFAIGFADGKNAWMTSSPRRNPYASTTLAYEAWKDGYTAYQVEGRLVAHLQATGFES